MRRPVRLVLCGPDDQNSGQRSDRRCFGLCHDSGTLQVGAQAACGRCNVSEGTAEIVEITGSIHLQCAVYSVAKRTSLMVMIRVLEEGSERLLTVLKYTTISKLCQPKAPGAIQARAMKSERYRNHFHFSFLTTMSFM